MFAEQVFYPLNNIPSPRICFMLLLNILHCLIRRVSYQSRLSGYSASQQTWLGFRASTDLVIFGVSARTSLVYSSKGGGRGFCIARSQEVFDYRLLGSRLRERIQVQGVYFREYLDPHLWKEECRAGCRRIDGGRS